MARHYQLHGVQIRAASDHPVAERALHRTLRYKGAEAVSVSRDADVSLEFDVGGTAASVPEEARLLGTGEKSEIDVWMIPDRVVLRRGDATVDLRPERGTAEAVLTPDVIEAHGNERRSPLFYMITFSLVVLLRSCGWFPLHAAGLAHDGRGALLVARSGSGKSTATLNLIREGWTYLSDDTVLLHSEGDPVRAWSFRRNLCVDPDAAGHFPELSGHEWPSSLSDTAKWQVDVDRIYPGQSAATCTPRLVVLPEIVDAPNSRVEPVDAKSVLGQLIDQGAFFLTPDSNVADRHLTILRRLIEQSRIYRLYAGRDALGESRTIHELLVPLLESPATAS